MSRLWSRKQNRSFLRLQSVRTALLPATQTKGKTLFACDTLLIFLVFFLYVRLVRCAVGWTMQAKRQSPQVPQPKAFLLIWYTWSLLFASEFVDDLASTWHTAGRKRNSCRGSHLFFGQHFYAALYIILHRDTTNFAGSGGDKNARCGCRILSTL